MCLICPEYLNFGLKTLCHIIVGYVQEEAKNNTKQTNRTNRCVLLLVSTAIFTLI